MYAVASFVMREINKGDVIDVGLQKVEWPAIIHMDVSAIHRHEAYWKEPNVFNPDRFMVSYRSYNIITSK